MRLVLNLAEMLIIFSPIFVFIYWIAPIIIGHIPRISVHVGLLVYSLILCGSILFIAYIMGERTFVFFLPSGPRVIYDAKNNTVINKLWYHQWLIDTHKRERRFFFVPKDVEIKDNISDVSYFAKLQLEDLTPQTVKKAQLHCLQSWDCNGSGSNPKLYNAVSSCVRLFTEAPFKVPDDPRLTRQGLTAADLNARCPLAPEFGYRWGSLQFCMPSFRCH